MHISHNSAEWRGWELSPYSHWVSSNWRSGSLPCWYQLRSKMSPADSPINFGPSKSGMDEWEPAWNICRQSCFPTIRRLKWSVHHMCTNCRTGVELWLKSALLNTRVALIPHYTRGESNAAVDHKQLMSDTKRCRCRCIFFIFYSCGIFDCSITDVCCQLLTYVRLVDLLYEPQGVS